MNVKLWGRNVGQRVRGALCGQPVAGWLVGAALWMVLGAGVRGVWGGPYQSPLMLRFEGLIPSVWAMTFAWVVWYALLGGAFAGVLLDRRRDPVTRAIRYRGGMSYLAMLLLGLFWYPLFFCAGRPGLALGLLLAVLALCIWTAIVYARTYRAAAVILACHALFLCWLAAINFLVVVRA